MRIKDAVRISITLHPHQLQRLRELSDRDDRSVSQLARSAVELFLDGYAKPPYPYAAELADDPDPFAEVK